MGFTKQSRNLKRIILGQAFFGKIYLRAQMKTARYLGDLYPPTRGSVGEVMSVSSSGQYSQ